MGDYIKQNQNNITPFPEPETQLVSYLSNPPNPLGAKKCAEQTKSTCSVECLLPPHHLLLVVVLLRRHLLSLFCIPRNIWREIRISTTKLQAQGSYSATRRYGTCPELATAADDKSETTGLDRRCRRRRGGRWTGGSREVRPSGNDRGGGEVRYSSEMGGGWRTAARRSGVTFFDMALGFAGFCGRNQTEHGILCV